MKTFSLINLTMAMTLSFSMMSVSPDAATMPTVTMSVPVVVIMAV